MMRHLMISVILLFSLPAASQLSWEQIPDFSDFIEEQALTHHFYSEIGFHNGELYLLFQQKQDPNTRRNYPAVIKYTGSGWEMVGNINKNADLHIYPRIFSFKGHLYMSFLSGRYKSEKIKLYRLDGSNWIDLKSPAPINLQFLKVVTNDDYIYFATVRRSNEDRISFYKYDGEVWSAMSDPTIPHVGNFDFDVNNDGQAVLSVIYSDTAEEAAGKGKVLHFAGNKWEQLGSNIYNSNVIIYTQIKYASDCMPYVIYDNSLLPALVAKYDGTNWDILPPFPHKTTRPSLIVNECVPYMNFTEFFPDEPGFRTNSFSYKLEDNAWQLVRLLPDTYNRRHLKTYSDGEYIYRYEYINEERYIIERHKFEDDLTNCLVTSQCNCEITEPIHGCTDPQFCEYDPNATCDDGSCLTLKPEEINCNDDCKLGDIEIWDDQSCECVFSESINGCTDPTALNFNPNANCSDGSCEYGDGVFFDINFPTNVFQDNSPNQVFSIQSDKEISVQSTHIYDIQGRIIYSSSNKQTGHNIDLWSPNSLVLSHGVYFYRVAINVNGKQIAYSGGILIH